MPRRKLTAAERKVSFNVRILPASRLKYARVCVREKVSQAKKFEQIITDLPNP